ncbi:uncharacterized protein LOC143305324 [Osmia lignaria lignaria]|uniref:uncharacterized protein LOC143305324 n=1 Tax=Osmia lignaria lignaria TaxID=1437193 RepID=UPI00402B4556
MKGLFFITIAAYMAYIVYTEDLPTVHCPPQYDENSDGPICAPHPCNCSAYYLCLPPMNRPQLCPDDQHFNNATKKCDSPANAKCETHPKCPKPENQDAVV